MEGLPLLPGYTFKDCTVSNNIIFRNTREYRYSPSCTFNVYKLFETVFIFVYIKHNYLSSKLF